MGSRKPKPIKPMTYSASCLQEVLDIVFYLKDTLETPLWFRGQGVYYDLVPSVLRHAKPIEDGMGISGQAFLPCVVQGKFLHSLINSKW